MKSNILLLLLLLLLPLADVLHASPARQNCDKTKSFTLTNECGDEYGGTWIECASGMTTMPTFLAPPCVVEAPSTIEPLTTSTPTLPMISIAKPVITTSACDAGHMICVDWLYWCNGDQLPWGDCFDPCVRETTKAPCPSITSGTTVLPPNTLPPASPTADPTPIRSTSTLPIPNMTTIPPRDDEPWCKDKPYMCAPPGW